MPFKVFKLGILVMDLGPLLPSQGLTLDETLLG